MIKYKKYILKNGLTLLIEQDNSTAMAAVDVLYKVGSKNESPEKTGFAHLFEHLMFGGSDHAPNYDEPLQMAGGENNACAPDPQPKESGGTKKSCHRRI